MMNPQFLHLEDPYRFEFSAVILQKVELAGNRIGVILDRSYFYPTSGGQEHDTGSIGEGLVTDVFIDETESKVVHVVDRDIQIGPVNAKIDKARRLRHMQHHTAQHLLTQCFVLRLDLDTVSANINGYSPSTLDLTLASLSSSDIVRVEDLANQIIYEDREVKTYFISPAQIHTIPLRRPPSVSKNIRIVEIDTYDFSPCGGTHCARTGMIGVIKILKTERKNDKTRIHFIAGSQALEYFRIYQDIVTDVAGQLSVHPLDIPETIQRQIDQLKTTQKELQSLQLERTALEAQELVAKGEVLGPYRLVKASFEGRPINEIRALANELKQLPNTITLLATYDGKKISLVVTCSEGAGIHARDLLAQQLSLIDGRGGGDLLVAQGGGPATQDEFKGFFENTRSLIQELLQDLIDTQVI